MNNLNFSQFIDNRISNIKSADNLAFALAIGIGPWVVPLGPAIIFGYALYTSAPPDMLQARLIAAVSVGVGLIVAGAVSSHTAIVAGGGKPWALVVGYIGLEIAGLWLMTVEVNLKVVGTVASLLTLIVYLSRSSAKEIDNGRADKKALLDDNRAKQWQLQLKKMDLEQVAKLARIEANKEVKLAQTQPAPDRKLAGNLPEANRNLPEWLPELPESLSHFRKLIGSGAALPEDITGAELGRIVGRSDRTGQNWLAAVRNGKAK